ncbi:hypothetical protein O181_029274 [Austropuccinia psidii MF-1]|uniref:Reverse transcriptase domain-containing protein n=1 Tax=Austropuccinia psidii MF-1 TaxID=1389203 RepID=A0A9Q3CS26_9BASI|nr:hypothetical protein [Austropuccinia psidii MF-1]
MSQLHSPKGEDLILGYDFLYHFNPIIDWKNELITYDSSCKDSSGITSSTSNDLATPVNSVALVGELKTPSLPPSVHIPSIIPSQSLLSSRDEVFKEIKDVGEDVAISSPHLFQGDMDLPTLSFHATLEEQWDEEEDPEEIKTVLKLEGLLPPVGSIYSLSKNESEILRAYISENVGKGFIRTSSSSTGACLLFVKKRDGGLCLCVDYCKLNAPTRKNRYPVPPMNQLPTIFNGSTVFSKNLVNDIFADVLDISVVVYLDDIMVFSSSEEEHVKHVASVLQRLGDNSEGLKMDSSKKDSPFIFNEEALSQFQILKEAFTTAPILSHFNPSLTTIVETDASDYPLGAVLSQVNDSGNHPIAFDSHKLPPAELNYDIHDKELLGIVWALKFWRAFLLSLSYSFEFLKDQSSLQYFMSSKVLTCRQSCLAEFLSKFHFSITYHLGKLATLPDDLSCWDNMYPERGVDFISNNPLNFDQFLKENDINESRFFSIRVEFFSDLVDQIQKAVWQDKDYKEILKKLARCESVSDYSLEPKAKFLLFKDILVIPSNHELQLDILQKRCENSFWCGLK